MTLEIILGLGITGLFAGFINSIAGGGSLLTLPALMLTGMPADVANGTNRVGVLCQAMAAIATFRGHGTFETVQTAAISLPVLVGAGLGALGASHTPNQILEPLLLGTMVIMAVVLTMRQSILLPDSLSGEPSRPLTKRANLGLLAAGFYGGFVQAGLGFILLSVFCGILNLDLVRANALKAATVFWLTVLALGVFVYNELVHWMPGLIIGVGGAAGAAIGARFALGAHAKMLRGLVLVLVFGATVVLIVR